MFKRSLLDIGLTGSAPKRKPAASTAEAATLSTEHNVSQSQMLLTRSSTVHFCYTLLYEDVRLFRPSYTRTCGISLPHKVGARSPASLASLRSAARSLWRYVKHPRGAVQVHTYRTKTRERACMVAFHAPSHSCTCCSTYESQI